MILLDLFIGFFKVGCFAFGGAYGAIPLIRDMVLSYGWLDDDMLSNMIAVSESTPGPIMVNLATYVGSSKAGPAGSILATFAVVLPSFIIILLLTSLFKTALKNPYIRAVLRGMKPCMAGIILATGVYMILKYSGIIREGEVLHVGIPLLRPLLLTIVLGTVYFTAKHRWKGSVTPIRLICLSAACGILIYGF